MLFLVFTWHKYRELCSVLQIIPPIFILHRLPPLQRGLLPPAGMCAIFARDRLGVGQRYTPSSVKMAHIFF
jgi:hypothetical protein